MVRSDARGRLDLVEMRADLLGQRRDFGERVRHLGNGHHHDYGTTHRQHDPLGSSVLGVYPVARWTGHQVHKTDRTLTRWGRKVERDF